MIDYEDEEDGEGLLTSSPTRREEEEEDLKKVAEAWCVVLGIAEAGREENFFELGGNSVLATRLMALLRQVFGVELPLRLTFEFPTIGGLARAIRRELGEREETRLERHEVIVRRDGEKVLSFAQQRLWFLSRLEPGPHYNEHFDLRLTGELDVDALEKALNEVVRRHEVLRSRVEEVEGEPRVVLMREMRVEMKKREKGEGKREKEDSNLQTSDFGNGKKGNDEGEQAVKRLEDGGEREEKLPADVEEAIVRQHREEFDLGRGPLIRAGLYRVGEREHILALTVHHIVIDGWSRGVILKELRELYEAFRGGRAPELKELPIQYSDFAAWQAEWLRDGKAVQEQLGYWKKQLAGPPELLELPTDRPRPAYQSYRGARYPIELDRETVEGLSVLGRQEGCTLFMVLLAGFQAVLSWLTGKEDIVVGSPIANRNRAEVEGLVGFFLNFLVMRGDLSGAPTFVELLGRVRKMCLEAYANQDVPFEMLVRELKPGRDLRHSPIFQVMFVLQNGGLEEVSAGGVRFSPMEVDIGVAKYELTLNLEERNGGCVGWLEYSTELFEEGTAGGIAEEFKKIMQNAECRMQNGESTGQRNFKLQTSNFKEASSSKLQAPQARPLTPALCPDLADGHHGERGNGDGGGACFYKQVTPSGVGVRKSEDENEDEEERKRARARMGRAEEQGIRKSLQTATKSEIRASTVRNGNGEVEEGVRRIWEEVLGRGGIRPEDDLFELGGHSLLITRIISKIRRVFGVEVPIYAFFETPTLGEIVMEVENAKCRMQNEEFNHG